MHLLIEALLIVVALIALTVAAVSTGLWRLDRRNRVSRAVPTAAPVWWLWSPSAPARLHRRLCGAVAGARVGLAPRPRRRGARSVLEPLVADLERAAADVDQRVVVATIVPRSHRSAMLARLSAEVAAVEASAHRLARMALGDGRPDGDALARLGERLDALDAARLELDGLDVASGLGRRAS